MRNAGTVESWSIGAGQESQESGVRSIGSIGEAVLAWQGPTSGRAYRQSPLLQRTQGLAEAGVVDTQLLAQGGSGARPAGLAELVAYGLGQRRWLGVGAVELESTRLAAATGQMQAHGLGCGGGAVLDGEA